MTISYRTVSALAIVIAASMSLRPSAFQQANPYLGAWTITPVGATTGPVYWLEVRQQDGRLSGMFLNGGGHALPLESVKVENGDVASSVPRMAFTQFISCA